MHFRKGENGEHRSLGFFQGQVGSEYPIGLLSCEAISHWLEDNYREALGFRGIASWGRL